MATTTPATTIPSNGRLYGRLELDLGGIPPGSRFLLGLSGGLDSAYLAWRLLDAGYRLHLFHVEYRTGQRRWPKEDAAHRAVLDWLAARGLTDWTIQRMSVEVGRLGYRYLDWEFFAWASGMILRAPQYRDITHIAMASCREDPARPETWARQLKIMELLAMRPLQIIRPKKRWSKTEFIADMPPDLFRLCWYCRRPDGDEPCHRCHTCRLVDAALEAGAQGMYEAKVIHRFRCKYDRRVYEPGDTYVHPTKERMEFLAAQAPPRVEWPPKDDPSGLDLGSLDYRELQRLAKERGIKANQSKDALLRALTGPN